MLATTQHRTVDWSFFLHARANYGLLAIEEAILLVSNHVTGADLSLDMYSIVDANDQTTSFITIRLGHRQSANVLSPEKQ